MVRSKACKRSETRIRLISQLAGHDGSAGVAGADGQLRIYGDGSAGSHTVSSSENWDGVTPAVDISNIQFTNFTIIGGATLTVPSGTVIRCSGTFTNNGTIVIAKGCPTGGNFTTLNSGTRNLAQVGTNPGISVRAPGPGEIGDSTHQESGGPGGLGIGKLLARLILKAPACGGTGGAPSTSALGGAGGGSVQIAAQIGIINAGSIVATGAAPGFRGGGGAVGIVILASKTILTNSGSINATGGAGASGDTQEAAAGGGACGGDGGFGSTILTNGSENSPGAATNGYAFETLVDPTALP